MLSRLIYMAIPIPNPTHMTETNPVTTPRVISAAAARSAARLFNYGNLLAVLLPLPLGMLWFAASIVVYAVNRHHPNPRVGYYTQQAAYRFYGVLGFVVVIATFFNSGITTWLITWALVAIILLPWTVWDLMRISQESWQAVTLDEDSP